MNLKIIWLLNIVFLYGSCDSQSYGIYVGEVESGVTYLSNSTLELKKENTFKLTNSITSLEAKAPSTNITKISGKFKKLKGQIILFPEKRRTYMLQQYAKTTNKTHKIGAINIADIVIDTIFNNPEQKVKSSAPILINITTEPNSIQVIHQFHIIERTD